MIKKQILLGHRHGTRYPDGSPVYPGKSSPDGRLLEGEYCLGTIVKLIFRDRDRLFPRFSLSRMPTFTWDVPIKQKVKMINTLAKTGECDCYVEIHTNAARKWGWKRKARGTVVFYQPWSEESKRMAAIISGTFKVLTELPSRGIKPGKRLGMLRGPKVPSILIEMGFHTSQDDVDYLLSDKGKEQIDEALLTSFKRF